jgi:hypothetical protein
MLFPQKKNKKNSLASNFFFSSIFAAYQKIKKISYFIWLLSKIYQLHQKQKKKSKEKNKKK